MGDDRLREHANRIEQLEGLRNINTHEDFYEKLASGRLAHTDAEKAQVHYVPVPITLKAQMGSPTAMAVGAFATTLTTLSCGLMGFRGLSVTTAFIADFLAIAGIGMFVSANWELVLGNTYAYTTLGSFGLFYFGFGIISIPFFGVADAYGGSESAGYNNAVGFFVLLWAVFNLFFVIGSLPLNIAFIWIFFTVEMAFILVAAGYFAMADGHLVEGKNILISGGAFGFASGMGGYYVLGNLMCSEAMGFTLPLGDTSRFFRLKRV